MKTIRLNILLLLLVSLFSCSNDDNEEELPRQQTCEISTGSAKYTECCLEGPLTAIPDQIFSVTYTTTTENPICRWTVRGNSITLVEGENSATAKFRVDKNFVKDTIIGVGYTSNGQAACSDLIIITAN